MGGGRETEAKIRVADLPGLRRRLEAAGALRVRDRHFEDNLLFDDASGSLRARGVTLRLRRTPGLATMTFKGPREIGRGVKSREERESGVADPDALEGILTGLGYRVVFRYQKYRESWRHLGQALELDETPIGSFLEIEGERDGILSAAAALGFSAEECSADSYVGLFLASGRTGDMVFGPEDGGGLSIP